MSQCGHRLVELVSLPEAPARRAEQTQRQAYAGTSHSASWGAPERHWCLSRKECFVVSCPPKSSSCLVALSLVCDSMESLRLESQQNGAESPRAQQTVQRRASRPAGSAEVRTGQGVCVCWLLGVFAVGMCEFKANSSPLHCVQSEFCAEV